MAKYVINFETPEMGGNGVLSTLKKGLDYLPKSFLDRRLYKMAHGPRNTATKRLDNFLDKTNDETIVDMKVGKKPIVGAVDKTLNFLSRGAWDRKKKQLGYDDVYHSYSLITTVNKAGQSKTYKLEKNHVIQEHTPSKEDYKNVGTIDLPKDKKLTIKQLVKTASTGDNDFYKYNPKDSNCQNFISDLITRNNLTPRDKQAHDVLKKQDAKQLVNSLGVLKNIPHLVTNIAGIADRGVYGDGIKKRRGFRKK